jgi:hypothetical protein
MQLLANAAGLRPAEDRTAAEFADDLAARIGEPAALKALAASYTRARYGGIEGSTESEDDANALDEHYNRVRGVLVRRALRRLTRFGRVEGGALARRDATAGTAR